MQIELNGEATDITQGMTIEELVDSMALATDRYAVEINEELVPRSQHANHMLHEGDKVEVVQAIGGG